MTKTDNKILQINTHFPKAKYYTLLDKHRINTVFSIKARIYYKYR